MDICRDSFRPPVQIAHHLAVDPLHDSPPGKTIVKLGLPDRLARRLEALSATRGVPLPKLAIQLLNEAVGTDTGPDVAALRTELRTLAAQTRRMEAALSIRRIPGLKVKRVQGTDIKVKIYPIDFALSPVPLYYNSVPDPPWVPSDEGALETRMPLPWPTRFSNKPLDQPFNSWRFYDNSLRISNHAASTTSEASALQRLAHELVDRLLEFSERQGTARFVVNRFEREYKRHKVTPPWTGAYGNGAALLGLCRLYERFEIERFREIADQLFAAFVQFRHTAADFWISEVDHSGYLWFVEMPLPGRDDQPRILNGHIRAIQGLYYYARQSRNAVARRLVQAGCTTVQRYALEYRRPGAVNCYDLTFPEYLDYGPKRTVDQQRFLAEITGDAFFVETAETFLTDMFWTPQGRRTDEPPSQG